MSSNQEVLKQIFDQAKDGDALGFLVAGVKKIPIELVTGDPCTHCAKIWNVARTSTEVSFNISEQTFSGGSFEKVKIILQEGLYYADNYHRLNDSEKIYFRPLLVALKSKQRKIGIEDAISQVGKRYGWVSLILGFPILEKLFPEFLRNKISLFLLHSARVCSTHVVIQDSKMGIVVFNEEMFYSPMEAISTPAYLN